MQQEQLSICSEERFFEKNTKNYFVCTLHRQSHHERDFKKDFQTCPSAHNHFHMPSVRPSLLVYGHFDQILVDLVLALGLFAHPSI
jgi:hypothetical protein